ncbi:hypothetical protein ACFV20_20885 [Streptomyces sp. NPDC059696]|uniref:hypothetical protein n=1 Tax=Streptomyces sp. NPDC059696 TaxID=3346911 RepID=UPI0036A5657F
MGVFARLLRRSKATAETPAAEVQADAAKAGTETEAETAEAQTAEAQTAEAAGATEAKGTDAEAVTPAREAGAEVGETEGVDIPKQQSTEKAADNEAGEGART